jgi:hypothetical protein
MNKELARERKGLLDIDRFDLYPPVIVYQEATGMSILLSEVERPTGRPPPG